MNNALRKTAIGKVTGLQVGFKDTLFVVMDNGIWRALSAAENTAVDTEYNAALLSDAKSVKNQELETAFQVASKLPVTVGPKTYNGGKESAQALRDYIQLVSESGGTDYTIWDSSNVIATYTLAEANAIKLAVALAVANAEFNLRTKKNAVSIATTITAVNAVVF